MYPLFYYVQLLPGIYNLLEIKYQALRSNVMMSTGSR